MVSTERVAQAFNRNVATVDARVRKFIESSDAPNTQALRKATRRLRSSYCLLPKELRRKARLKRYVSASRRVTRATGKVRDFDIIVAWSAQVTDPKDRRSFTGELERLRAAKLDSALAGAKKLRKARQPSVDADEIRHSMLERRARALQKRLGKRLDDEFEEFLSTQEVDVMHALRKDSRRLRHLVELTREGEATVLIAKLRSIQDDLGAIRDHDLVIDYLRGRVRLTSTRSLIREEIAKRHARLEDFVTKNRGQGHLLV